MSLFASRDEAGTHYVLVALNLKPDVTVRAKVNLEGIGRVVGERVFSYGPGSAALTERPAKPSETPEVSWMLDPYSMTVFDLKIAKANEAPKGK